MHGDRGTAAYTNVPVGAGGTANYPTGATAPYTNVPAGAGVAPNYPASQRVSATGGSANYPAGHGVSHGYSKSGYGHEYDGSNVKSGYGVKSGYSGGGAYVQPTPVSYGPDGRPIVRKSHRMRNAILGTLAVCCCCVAL